MRIKTVQEALCYVQRKCPVLSRDGDTRLMSQQALSDLRAFCFYQQINATYLSHWPDTLPVVDEMPEKKLFIVREDEAGKAWSQGVRGWEGIGAVVYVLREYARKGDETAQQYFATFQPLLDSIPPVPEEEKPTIDAYIGYASFQEIYHAMDFARRHGMEFSSGNVEIIRALQFSRSNTEQELQKHPEIINALQSALENLAIREEKGDRFGDAGVAANYRDAVAFIVRHHGLLSDSKEKMKAVIVCSEVPEPKMDVVSKLIQASLRKQRQQEVKNPVSNTLF